MVKSVIAVIVTWLVGILWFMESGFLVSETSGQFAYLVKLALFGTTFPVFIVTMPLFIGLTHKLREGRFPHGLFTGLTYAVLFVVAAIMFGYIYYAGYATL